jgi:MFS family permease
LLFSTPFNAGRRLSQVRVRNLVAPGYGTSRVDGAMTAPLRLTLLLCLVQMLAMGGSLTFQALIPVFIDDWQLSNTEAAWIGGASYVGYALTAPVLVGLTDRIDARRIVVLACLLSGVAGLGFAVFAAGFWSAFCWRFLTGIGIAGSYMPGLKALTDRLPESESSGRPQAFYSATFSLASAASLLLAGLATAAVGWPLAFAATGIMALLAAALVVGLPAKQPFRSTGSASMASRVGDVLRDRPTMRYIAAYAAHAWEMFAFRTWIVTFLTFAAVETGTPGGAVLVSSVATVLILAGLPAGLVGNEFATRTNRRLGTAVLMLAAAGTGALLGLAAGQNFVLVATLALAYGTLLMTDNSAILVGTIQSTPAERRGAAIAVQTFLAAAMALISPLTVGAVLDAFGSGTTAWTLAFLAMATGPLVGAVTLWWPKRR